MPKPILFGLIAIGLVAVVPPILIARSRASLSREPRLHLVGDMDNQHRFEAQSASALFQDHRSSRLAPEGTVARGELQEDGHLYRGRTDRGWATSFPESIEVDLPFLQGGQERYGIYCAPCHGFDGLGRGTVARRAEEVSPGSWIAPTSLHAPGPEGPPARPLGHLFNTITHGIRNMPPYESQIEVRDRWAIVAYVRALQRSQNADGR